MSASSEGVSDQAGTVSEPASTRSASPSVRPDAGPSRRRRRRSPSQSGSQPGSLSGAVELAGSLRVHHRGFGFVVLDDTPGVAPGVRTDLFVAPDLLGGFLDGDLVAAVPVSPEPAKGPTVERLRLVRRTRTHVFGFVSAGTLALEPRLGTGRMPFAAGVDVPPDGAGVVAELSSGGVVPVEVFDAGLSPESLRAMALCRHRIRPGRPPQASVEAATEASAASEPPAVSAGGSARRDLRALTTLTIDADTSMDLDDALSVRPAGPDGTIVVWVHIADVAAHVPAGGAVDADAAEYGTSVYLPGWTRPMLPPALAHDALSLLPGVDRDAVTVEMRVGPDGTVRAVDVYESRICSDRRLSYELVAQVLSADGLLPPPVPGLADEVVAALRWLRTAASRLASRRAARGGFDARHADPDLHLVLTGGEPTMAASGPPATVAHDLVERLMVAANESVAVWARDRSIPVLFRVHPRPPDSVGADLEVFAESLGYHLGLGSGVGLTPQILAGIESQLADAPSADADALWDVILSKLGRASYTPVPSEHFGLGSGCYLHFTSPIRRYADLVVHRSVKAFLAGARSCEGFVDPGFLAVLAEHLNVAAGAAARAESDNRRSLFAQALADPTAVHVGRVIGFASAGARVILEGSFAHAFVPFRSMSGGRLELDVLGHSASSSRRTVRIGDRVRLRLCSCDPVVGSLDGVEAR